MAKLLRRFRRQPVEFVEEGAAVGSETADRSQTAAAVAEAPMMIAEAEAGPQPRGRLELRPAALIAVILVVALAVAAALGLLDQIPTDLVARWPWLLVILGALATVVGLITSWSHAILGGPALAAVGLVALLDTATISSVGLAVAGGLLVALGLAVIVRGLTTLQT
jgi:hypothetical protein